MCQKDFRKIPSFPVTIASTMPVKTMAAWHTGYQNMRIRSQPTACGKIQLRMELDHAAKNPSLTWRYEILRFKSNQNVCVLRRKVLCWDIIWTYMCRIYNLEMQAVQVLQYDVKHSPFNRLLFGDENNQNVKHFKVRHVRIESGPKSMVSWHLVSIAPAKTCPYSTLVQRFRAKNSITFRSEVLYVHHVTCKKITCNMSDTFCPPIDVVEDAAISLLPMYLVFRAQPAVLLFFGRFLSLSQKKVKMSEWTTSTIDKTKQTEPLGFKIAGHSQVRECRIMSNLRFTSPYPTPRRK